MEESVDLSDEEDIRIKMDEPLQVRNTASRGANDS
jgi:hypothetical protein